MDKQTYVITNMTNGDEFEMELTFDEYMAIEELKDKLGYVMEDVRIEEK